MKKHICLFLVFAALLSGCEKADPFDPAEYTFPPEDVREMEWALDEAGLDAYKAEDARMTTNRVPDDIAVMRLTKAGGKTVVILNMLLRGGVERQGNISFGYNQQPGEEEQLNAFVEEDYPLFWKLAGIAFEAPEETEKLSQSCAGYFTTPPEGQLPEWKWSGSEGEVYCNVYYFFHPGFGLWLPSQIELYNEAAYKALPKQ